MEHQLTEILDLPGIIIKEKKFFDETIILEVEKRDKTDRCPLCNCVSRRLHQNHFSLIKDLPWGEKEVFLRINRRQFKCTNCRKPFSSVQLDRRGASPLIPALMMTERSKELSDWGRICTPIIKAAFSKLMLGS
ncbi:MULTISPECIES: transposase family protein [Aerosakkonema]|uniref:transposase family protein n=1 Tax=Aerosakkonema TaxID=1246629 RepID=UPI0035BA5EFE